MIRVEHGDCLEVIPQLVADGVLVDAIVTDPPYGLEFMGVAWDTMRDGGTHRTRNEWGDFGSREHPRRSSETGRIARNKALALERFSSDWAAAAYEVLKPGGYLLAFGGSRTHHRIWSAIEGAGFVIQDTIMWLHGQGFPKGRTQLKPAHEPICVAYKPGGKRELQIEECCVPLASSETATERKNEASQGERYEDRGYANKPGSRIGSPLWGGPMKRLSVAPGQQGALVERQPPKMNGRWPANVCHDGSDEVMGAFAAFHTANHGSFPADKTKSFRGGARKQTGVKVDLLDQGSPARFYYAAKASKADRAGSKHPTVKPVALMRWLVRLVTPPGGTVLDPFAGSGTTGAAAIAEGRNAILIEREDEYIGDIQRRLSISRGEGGHSMVAKRLDRQEVRGTLL